MAHAEFSFPSAAPSAVLAMPIGATAHTLLTACAAGHTLPDALAATQAQHPETDLRHTLATLVTQGAFTATTP